MLTIEKSYSNILMLKYKKSKEEGEKMEKNIKEKGITLIALVITIIILLILAGVTINIAIKTGLMEKTEAAVDRYTQQELLETLKLELIDYKMANLSNNNDDDDESNIANKLKELGPTRENEDEEYETAIKDDIVLIDKDTLDPKPGGPSNTVPPTKIRFDKDKEELYIGESKIFKIILEPAETNVSYLQWSVSDDNIATIQNGVMEGKKVGTVTITVSSKEDPNIKATCEVTVKTYEITKLEFKEQDFIEAELGKTKEAELICEPSKANKTALIWTSSDETIATVENGIIKGLKKGIATIKVQSPTNANVKAEKDVLVEEVVKIYNLSDLKKVRDEVNAGDNYLYKRVVLMNDIDMNPGRTIVESNGIIQSAQNAECWEPIGRYGKFDSTCNVLTETGISKEQYNKEFSGNFDGQGYKIKNLYIGNSNHKDDRTHGAPYTGTYQGLFGVVKGEHKYTYIKNVVLDDVFISSNYYSFVGGLACVSTGCSFDSCGVTGNIYISRGDNVRWNSMHTG